MKRRSLYAAAVSGIALTTAVVLSPVAGASTSTFTGHSPTTALAGQVALQGRILDENGAAVVGARVQLYAWPASWPGKQVVKRGEQVPLRLVGRAISTAAGRYAIRVDAAALRPLGNAHGIVNLRATVVGVTDPSGGYPFSVRIGSAASNPAVTSFPAGSGTATAERVFRLSGSAARLAEHPRDSCLQMHSSFVRSYKPAWGTVDQTYMNRSRVQAQASIVRKQTTTFSIGESASGDVGSFKANGTFTFSNTIGFKWPWFSGPSSQDYQLNYTPAKYKIYFTPHPLLCSTYFVVQAEKQRSGHRVISAGKIPGTKRKNCDPQGPQGTLSITTTKASTISAALTIKEVGFSASAQTGWSNTDTISYRSSLHTWWLCGTNGDPADAAPGRLVAGNRPRR